LRVFGHVSGQKFERNETMEPGVLGFVDDAHSATAQAFQDAIVRESLVDERVVSGLAPHLLGDEGVQINEARLHLRHSGRSTEFKVFDGQLTDEPRESLLDSLSPWGI
jgi:hypothetical protein